MVFQASILDFLSTSAFIFLIFAKKHKSISIYSCDLYIRNRNRLDNCKVSLPNFFSFYSPPFLLFRSLVKNKLSIATNFKLNSKTFKCFTSSKNQHLLNNRKS